MAKGGGGGGNSTANGGKGSGGTGGASGSGVGTTKFSGGNGGNTGSTTAYSGGGGGSAGTAANGTVGGNTGNGAAAVTGGGAGGNGFNTSPGTGSGSGSVGGSPGGGGGGSRSTGSQKNGGNGANGQVVLTYSIPAPSAYKIQVAGSSSATTTAGSNVSLTVTALDSSGNQLIGLYQDVTLNFYGLASSPSNTVPKITDRNGTSQTVNTSASTPNVILTFTNGMAAINGANNGVLKAYNAATATLNCIDGNSASSASGTGAAGLSLTVAPAAATQLVFSTAPQNIPVGTTSATMSVQRKDAYGNPNTADATLTVNLSSDSGTGSFRDNANTTTITSTNIITGSSSVSFKYNDSTLGTPTLTAAATGLTSGTQLETVSALTWLASPASYNWNTSDANWTGAGVYSDGNGVTFDDTGSASSPINLVGQLQPTSVSISTSSKNYTFSGSGYISGSATLTKSGTATLTNATANDYTGATTIFGGVMDVQNSTALGNSATTVAGGAAVQVDGSSLNVGEAITVNGSGVSSGGVLRNLANANTVSGNITLASDSRINSDAGTLTFSGGSITGATNLTVGGAGNVAIAENITTTGKLTKDGSGTLTLSGANTYTGNTTVSAGVLSLLSTVSLASPSVVLNGGDLLGHGTFTFANNIGIGAISGSTPGTGLIDAAAGQTFTLSGAVASAGNTGANALIVNSGVGNNGTVVLAGVNTFTGTTVISNGTLQVANALALQNSTVNYNNQGGSLTFDSTITSATFGGLSGAQNLSLNNLGAGAVALNVGSNNAATTYSGALSGGGSLTKIGTGKLTLTGNNNYSGNTLAAVGILELPAGGVINGGSASVSQVAGAQLQVDGGLLTATTGNIGVPSAGLLVSGSGSANYSGALGMDLGNNNDSVITVSGGTLTANSLTLGRTSLNNGSQPTTGSTTVGLYVNGGAVIITNNLEMGNTSSGNSSVNARIDTGSVTVGGALIAGLANLSRWSDLDVAGGTLTVADIATGLSIGSSQNGNIVVLVRNSATVNAGKISFGNGTSSGSTVLSQTGSGSTIYVGSGGIAQVSPNVTVTNTLNAGTLGASADWTGTVPLNLSGSAYTIKAADASGTPHNITLGATLSGSAAVAKTGGGTLTLTTNNTYSGNTTVSAGTLALANDGVTTFGAIASGTVTIAGGAAFDVSQVTGYTLASSRTVAGYGAVVGPFTAAQNSTIIPAGIGAEGTLTFSNNLTLSGVNLRMDLTSDPTGVTATNDAINVVGDVTATSTNTVLITPVTQIGLGTYKLLKYSGTFYGTASNFFCSIGNIVTTNAGEIDLVISSLRPATNVVWRGDGGVNLWDSGVSTNWLNGATLDRSFVGDTNYFNDSATNFIVNTSGQLLPAAVVVNATNDYTFTGIGDISGNTGLTKTNIGKLTISCTNDYNGVTTINGGILSVSTLANGSTSSPIGAATNLASSLVINGGALEYRGGNLSIDRGATLGVNGGTISVTNAIRTLTVSGVLAGPGVLIKSGLGTLTLPNVNTYGGGTVVSNGTLVLGSNNANNDGAGGSALGSTNNNVSFYGGTLALFGYNGSTGNNYATLFNPLVVPSGQSGTLLMWPRGPSSSGSNSGLKSSLTGGGTLNLVVNYVRDNLDGDWSAFTGLINVTPRNGSGDEMRINNTHGYGNAAIYLNAGVLLDYQVGANATVDIGELGGASGASVGTGSLSPANTTWRVGGKNTSATFDGTIANDAAIIKVGTGVWTLTGANTYTGSTIVSNGTLQANNTSGSGTGTGAVTINGGTLAGSGTVGGATTLNAGAILSPGSSRIGTLTFSGNLTLNAASTNSFAVTTAGGASNSVTVAGTLSPNSSVIKITSGTALAVGTYTLFNYASISGSFNATPVFDVAPAATASIVDTGTKINLVIGTSAGPTISSIVPSGADLILNATGGSSGGSVSVLTSTNLALPLASWTTVTTGSYDGSGNFSYTVSGALSSGQPQQFYILKQ